MDTGPQMKVTLRSVFVAGRLFSSTQSVHKILVTSAENWRNLAIDHSPCL